MHSPTAMSNLNQQVSPNSSMYAQQAQLTKPQNVYNSAIAQSPTGSPTNPALADQKNINLGSKLFVGQVPAVCTEEMLYPVFKQYGTILEVKIMRDYMGRSKGSAWVRYETADMAQKAIDALHEKHTIPPQTNPLRVQFANPSSSQRPRMNNIGQPDMYVMQQQAGIQQYRYPGAAATVEGGASQVYGQPRAPAMMGDASGQYAMAGRYSSSAMPGGLAQSAMRQPYTFQQMYGRDVATAGSPGYNAGAAGMYATGTRAGYASVATNPGQSAPYGANGIGSQANSASLVGWQPAIQQVDSANIWGVAQAAAHPIQQQQQQQQNLTEYWE